MDAHDVAHSRNPLVTAPASPLGGRRAGEPASRTKSAVPARGAPCRRARPGIAARLHRDTERRQSGTPRPASRSRRRAFRHRGRRLRRDAPPRRDRRATRRVPTGGIAHSTWNRRASGGCAQGRASRSRVGSIPGGYDGDAVRYLHCIFGLADSYGAMLDLHLHHSGELGASEAELVIERTRALGLEGRVTISHAFFLGSTVTEPRARELLEQIADAKISLATVVPGIPSSAASSLRRAWRCGGPRVRRDSGSVVAFRIPDLLERAMLLAWRSGFRRDDDLRLALEAAISGGARIMGLDRYGLEAGCRRRSRPRAGRVARRRVDAPSSSIPRAEARPDRRRATLMRLAGFEPAASRSGGARSIP